MKPSIGRMISLLSREIAIELKDVVEPFGITVGEELYFMALAHEDGITQDRLTEIVCVDKSATARAVKALENKGLIRRDIDQIDKRNKKLYLTNAGHEMYPGLSKALNSFNEKLTSSWTDEQYDQVYHSLAILQHRFKK